MFYLIGQMLFSLLVASALGALVGWLAKASSSGKRHQVFSEPE